MKDEKVTFEVATRLKTAMANLAAEISTYSWSDDFKIKELNLRIYNFKKDIYFVPFHEFTKDQLKTLGFGLWEEELFLVPIWLYRYIPFGIVLESINGDKITVKKGYNDKRHEGYIDTDIRFGCIAFGINFKNKEVES